MGGTPAFANSSEAPYAHLIDKSRPWWKNSRLVLLNFWIGLLLLTSSANGYDGSMMNGLQSVKQWKEAFNYPTGGKLGLLNAIQNIGSVAGYPFVPYMTDGIGRRLTIAFGIIFMIAATVVQTAAQSVEMFIGARFMIGFGLVFANSAAPLLVTEIAYPSQRGPLTSVYNTLWNVGSITAAWTTFGTFHIPTSWAWRVPSAIQALPSVIQIFFIWFMPESPRWLVSKGRHAEALRTLAYYHASGNEKDPLVEYEFEEIKAADALDREINANVGWLSLVRTPGNRKRMRIIVAIAFFSQWSGNGLISYYLNKVLDGIGITSSTIQLLINAILNVWSLVLAVSAGFLCDRFGRRPMFITSTIGMTITWTMLTVCTAMYAQHGTAAAAHAVIAMIILHSATYVIAFLPLIVSYSIEILPYPIRAKGFMVFGLAVSVSLIFNQYVNPIALDKLGWKYYLVYVFWNAFEAVFCYLYVIETRNRTLEETAALFDGDEAVAMITEKGEKAGRGYEADSSVKEKVSITEIEIAEKA
ncbi:hexose transporter [Dentipellis sp. KUC8613]|nr:hexose transporter [Dentipellis sp. KUC8613]